MKCGIALTWLNAFEAVRSFRAELAVAFSAAALLLSGAIAPLHNWITDSRFKLAERPASGEIVLVAIDPQSLSDIGVWPWPRSLHSRAIEALTRAGSGEIFFDVDFSLPSSPAEDAIFERALESAGGLVTLPVFRQARTSLDRDVGFFNHPIEAFARHAWPAAVNVVPDDDGRVRRLSYGGIYDGEYVYSFSAFLAGNTSSSDAEFKVDYSIDPGSVPTVSFSDLLDGAADEMVRDKKVVIGATAVELHDTFTVPAHGTLAGPLLQILGAESIMQARALRDTGPVLGLAGILFIILTATALRKRAAWQAQFLILISGAGAIEGGAVLLQAHSPVIFASAPWHVTFAMLAVVTILRQIDIERLLRRISKREADTLETMLERVVSDNASGIVISDEAGKIQLMNEAAQQLLAVRWRGRDACQHIVEILPNVLVSQTKRALNRYSEDGSVPTRSTIVEIPIAGNNIILEYMVSVSTLPVMEGRQSDEGNLIACLTVSDVTLRQRALAELDHMAHFDPLTGLANRNQLVKATNRAFIKNRQHGESFIAIYFDLTRFKTINDTLGHHIGDLLLKAVATRGREALPSNATLARFGGDEFVAIVLGVSDRDDAATLAADLLCHITKPYDIEGHHAIVGARAGIAMADDADSDAEAIIRCADLALHHTSSNEGDVISFYKSDFEANLNDRRETEVELFQALERGEFEIYYQPQVDIRTGRINGAEALIRWHRPRRGLTSPDLFIPILEDVGLISDIGRWTITQSCKDAARWPREIKVAVNLSPRQFQTSDLVSNVREALMESGLDEHRLDLEITESLLVDETESVKHTIKTLTGMGIGLALDDFGTGYSALSYIQRFPLSKIKIDQAFVADLVTHAGSQAIVRAVTSMAEPLDLTVTAEGIETEEQEMLLRIAGCDQGQGYLYGRPMPAASFELLLAWESDGQDIRDINLETSASG